MHKQVISFVQVIKFLENMDVRGGVNPKTPLAYALERQIEIGHAKGFKGCNRSLHVLLPQLLSRDVLDQRHRNFPHGIL